ncbi:MAG: hypothetical protein HF978_00135 [Desulfobacteraceae bacterium]|nr:alkaline phosphatase family protein [Desulfobacteraceae bacterium]MBC2753943.1 hypothetical protein [Desulfobacteraceae bacterium]
MSLAENKKTEIPKKKVFIIGLDGATFDLIRPWVDAGKLPALSRLMEQGTYGVLKSVVPPFTAPAWASFLTGKAPESHGIFFFLNRNEKDYHLVPSNSSRIQGQDLGSIISRHHRRVALVNVPVTYPPRPVNGIVVSGLGTPGQHSRFTYPDHLREQLISKYDYEVERTRRYHTGIEKEFISTVNRVEEKRFRAVRYLMETTDWDLFSVVFRGTDILGHALWRFMDQTHAKYEPDLHKIYGQALLEHYQMMDNFISDIWRRLDEDTTLIVMSDHGMGPLHRYVYLDGMFYDWGLLKIKPGFISRLKLVLFKHGLAPHNIIDFLTKTGLREWIRKHLSRQKTWKAGLKLFRLDIDWERTLAYPFSSTNLIYLNVAGRDPQGIVKPGEEYERLVKYITSKLLKLRDPLTGDLLVEKVLRKEEIYPGNCVTHTPDLWVQWKDDRYTAMSGYSSRNISEILREPSGTHTMSGIFLAAGSGIKNGDKVDNASIIDIAPTALHIMGEPVPVDMDGQVLKEIFKSGSVEDRQPAYEGESMSGENDFKFTDTEKSMIEKRLRDLGYLA